MPPDSEKSPKKYERCVAEKFSNIPEAIKRLPQWVCWQAEWKPERGKFSKIPINPNTGREAKSNAPTTWGTYDEALSLFEREGSITGLGFEFSVQDPFTFIDLDDARDPATGEIGDWAQEIISKLDSYTEVSPSGTGIRILIEADPVGSSKRRGKIEIYSFGQYATITGDVIRQAPVSPRQAELADLYALVFGVEEEKKPEPATLEADPKLARVRLISDDDLIAKATSAANGVKFLKLWNAEDVTDHSLSDAALCSILAYWTRGDADRIDRLFRISRLMRPKWDERRGADTYGQRTINFAIKAATALYDPDLDGTLREGRNDVANAEIFVQLNGPRFCYNLDRKEWLMWNCHRWQENADLDLLFSCEDVSKELLRRATANPLPDAKLQTAAVKWAIQSGDGHRIDQINKFAQRRLKQHGHLFNRDPYLLACENGIVDLRTGDLRDGQPGDWITRSTGIRYDAHARCPVFEQFLREIMCFDDEMTAYMWRGIGYCLTGDTTERAFFLLHGGGRNGKTTFVETLQAVMGAEEGGYAQRARFNTFLRKSTVGGANDDVAHLSGARLVVASEADDRAPLDTAAIKELTGGDAIRARHLYAKEFQFRPIFKLMLVTNHVPPIQESTHSLWDRLHYIAFDYRIPDNKVDRNLRLRLMGELEGIFARSVKACLEWQRNGLAPPEKVLHARADLEHRMDTLGQFLAEACELGDANKYTVTSRQLYYAFSLWCRENGIKNPPSNKWFTAELRNKKFTEHKIGNVSQWIGLKLTGRGSQGEMSEL